MSHTAVKVIIPKFSDYESSLKYFIPRFAKTQRGESVGWTNLDNIPHSLAFYKILDGKARFIRTLGPISPGAFVTMVFPYDIVDRIDYYCDIHRNEVGSVIIFSQNEETMTNTERLRFLGRVFDINPPDILAHLRG